MNVDDLMQYPAGSIAVVIIGVIGMIAAVAPKWLGGFGKAWEEWLLAKRRADELRDDADITELQRQIKHLTSRLDHVIADIEHRDRALHCHAPWDHEAVTEIARLGGKIAPPPPLWPRRHQHSPTEPPGDAAPTP